MHKIFMTDPEVSIIQGADAMVEALGGFPSMENGSLLGISVQDSELDYQRYDVSLLFDIERWAIDSSRYINLPKPMHKYIRLQFACVRNVYINSPSIHYCGEFKFGNTADRKQLYQDALLSHPITIERPFCAFYMQAGQEFFLEFNEEECKIFASFFTPTYIKNRM